jgi:hypothetical protein
MILAQANGSAESSTHEDRAHCWTLNGSQPGTRLNCFGDGSGGWQVGYRTVGPQVRMAVAALRLGACSCRFCLLSGHVPQADRTRLVREQMAVGRTRHLGTPPMDTSCDTARWPKHRTISARSSTKICWRQMSAPRARVGMLWTPVHWRRSVGLKGANWVDAGCRPVHGVQIELNIADVSAPAIGQQPVTTCNGAASLVAKWPASLRWTRRLVIWRARKWQGFCAYSRMRNAGKTTQCPEGEDQGGFKVSAGSGRAQLNTWRSHRTARVITSARSGKLCAVFEIGSNWALSNCAHAFDACAWSIQSTTMVPLCTGCCSVPPWRRTL